MRGIFELDTLERVGVSSMFEGQQEGPLQPMSNGCNGFLDSFITP